MKEARVGRVGRVEPVLESVNQGRDMVLELECGCLEREMEWKRVLFVVV